MTWFDTLTHNQTKALKNTKTGLGLLVITKCLKYVSDFKQSITCLSSKDSITTTSIISSWVLSRLAWFGSSLPKRVILSSVTNVPSLTNLIRLNPSHNLYSTIWRPSTVMILTMLRRPCHLSEMLRTIITLLARSRETYSAT